MKSTRKNNEYRSNKTKRPFIEKRSLHVTLRSEIARGAYSMANRRISQWLRDYVPVLAKRLGIRLFHFSQNGNHLHFVLMASSRRGLSNFLRVLGGMIPRKVLGAEKGRRKGVQFWVERPYSRVLSWGKEFRNVLLYIQRNVCEALGTVIYQERTAKISSAERKYIERTFELSSANRVDWLECQLRLF